MNCPGCGTGVADGTAICPKCDYIIDASFLGDLSAPPETDEGASQKPKLRPNVPVRAKGITGDKPSPGPARPKPARPAARPAPRAAPRRPPPPPEPVEPEPEPEPEPDWHVKPSPAAARAAPAGPGGMMAPEEAFSEAREFVSGMGTADKIALAGAGIVILASFFPWKETLADGEVLGLMSMGVVGFISAVITLLAIVFRVRGTARANPLLLWVIQLGTSGVATLWCLIFIKASWDGRKMPSPIGNFEMAISRPSFGVVLALVGALVALGGTLMGLKER